jgi:hypothetical protein
MELTQTSQTDWNGGTLTNIRIHTIREEIRVAVTIKNMEAWLGLLEQMNHELYGFQTPKEKLEIRKQIAELYNKIGNQKKINNITKKASLPPQIIDGLHNLQYSLDEIFHKSGLQTALREDAGDVF